MNSKKHTIIPYRQVFQFAGKAISEHIHYCNIIFLIIVAVWLYLFITDYYLAPKEDFSFIASKSSEIYDVALNGKAFNDAYMSYRNKQTAGVAVPSFVKNPF